MAKGHRWASWFWSQKPEGYNRLGSAVYLLMHIAETADYDSGRFDYNQTRAARELGLSRSAVVAQHDHLERLGWLERAHRGRYGIAGQLSRWMQFQFWCQQIEPASHPQTGGYSHPQRVASEAAEPGEMSRNTTTDPPEMSRNATSDVTKHDNSGSSCTESCHETRHNHVDHESYEAGAGAGSGALVFQLWREHIGEPVTSGVAVKLRSLQTTYPEEWLARAFDEASDHGGRSLRYVKNILERWQREGFGADGRRSTTAPAAGAKGQPSRSSAGPAQPRAVAAMQRYLAKKAGGD